jgi:RecA-family ATPase
VIVEDLRCDWFQPLNWAELDQAPAAEVVIPDLLYKGESGSLVAQGGTGKSLLMFDICVSLALGLPVLGAPARDPMTVIYIDMENNQQELVKRLRSMGHDPSYIPSDRFFYLSFPELQPLDTPQGGQMLAAIAQLLEPELIVFDTISRLVEGKEDSADTWRNLYLYTMLPLRRQGRTVLRLDHQGHDTAKGARGSSAKRDDVDVAWIMKSKGNVIELKLDKGRGLGHPEKVELRREQKPLSHISSTTGGKTGGCIEAMDQLDVPDVATRDEAASMLRANGYQFENRVIGEALKARRPSASRRTAPPLNK